MGKIWFYMISIGIVGSIITNNLGELNKVILNEASRGVEFAISLAGVMALWMGIMNIAKDSGLIDKIGKKLNPIIWHLIWLGQVMVQQHLDSKQWKNYRL